MTLPSSGVRRAPLSMVPDHGGGRAQRREAGRQARESRLADRRRKDFVGASDPHTEHRCRTRLREQLDGAEPAVRAVAQREGVPLAEQALERVGYRLAVELGAHLPRLAHTAHFSTALSSDLVDEVVQRYCLSVYRQAVVLVLEDAQGGLFSSTADSARDDEERNNESCGEPCHGPNLTSLGLPPQPLIPLQRAAPSHLLWRSPIHIRGRVQRS